MKMTYKNSQKSVQNLRKTSEVFCKPSNLAHDGLNEINSIANSCTSYDDHASMMCNCHNSFVNQQIVTNQDEHSRYPCYYITGGNKYPLLRNQKSSRQPKIVKRIDFKKTSAIGPMVDSRTSNTRVRKGGAK